MLGAVHALDAALADAALPDAALPDAAPPPLGAPGTPCDADAECADERCLNLYAEFGFGRGYCTIRCAADADCDVVADGFDHTCGRVAGVRQCVRTCVGGFGGSGCPETDVCIEEFDLGGGAELAICQDFGEECQSDANCPPDARCTVGAWDNERFKKVCLALGEGVLHNGDACDPRSDVNGDDVQLCRLDADCPADWTCGEGDAGRRICISPVGCLESNAPTVLTMFGCSDHLQCAGPCDDDLDCGADQRCSAPLVVAGVGDSPWVDDDRLVRQGACSYAAGSRTPCVRESDCSATGQGGTREVWRPSLDASGARASICVAPGEGFGVPGDACGDDPATPERDVGRCGAGDSVCRAGECRAPCGADPDCAPDEVCQYLASYDVDASFGVCLPAARCARDADCASGRCSLVGTGLAMTGLCAPAQGALGTGAACVPGGPGPFEARCASSCKGTGAGTGQCAGPCVGDDDCPADFACSAFDLAINGRGTPDRGDDVVVRFATCEYVPGTRLPCEHDADCPMDEVCGRQVDADGLSRRVCRVGGPGDGVAGDECFGGADCGTRYGCIARLDNAAVGYCLGDCSTSADCPDGLACQRYISDLRNQDLRICVQPGLSGFEPIDEP